MRQPRNGSFHWSQRSVESSKQLSYSDLTIYRIPFMLGVVVIIDEDKARVKRSMEAAIGARSTRSGIPGCSAGSTTWSLDEVLWDEQIARVSCSYYIGE